MPNIKPDNIVLRNGSLLEPVVVDFGQSFNAEDENHYQTHDEQTLGNRFLALPELVENSNNKREILLKSVKLLNQIDMQLDIENIKKALHAPERQRLNALRELFKMKIC